MFSTAMRADSSDSSSTERSLDRESQSDDVLSEEDDDVRKETQNVPSFPSDSCGQERTNCTQQGPPNILPSNGETPRQVPQIELVAQSVTCAPNPFYGGMMTAYGQPLLHAQFVDVQTRMPLALEMAPEPVYVNAKQYHAILRRRQSRAKAELEKKLIKDRKPYLHESRHQHAMRRIRGSGGRFAKKTEIESLKNTTASDSTNSANSNRVHSESAETPRDGSVNSENYQASSGYHLHSSDRGEQWINISSNQAPQSAVAM